MCMRVRVPIEPKQADRLFQLFTGRANLESRTERSHLDTLRVAVPHLGLPARGRIRRHALRKSKVSPGSGSSFTALLGQIWGLRARPGVGNIESLESPMNR